MTEEQTAIAEAQALTVCAIAGPGSGKTHTLAERFGRFSGEDTVIITYTHAAAYMLKKRIITAKPQAAAPRFVGTLHAFCLRTLRERGRPGITLLDEDEADAELSAARDELRLKVTTSAARKVLAGLKTPAQAETVLMMRYRARLRALDAEDYDTLLLSMWELAQREPVRVGHLMVDEYQDSGIIDEAIYAELTCTRRFIVGDPDQSIFGFRGGRMENLIELSNRPGVFTGFMEGNFRCAGTICDAASRLISHNRGRLEKVTKSLTGVEGTIVRGAFETEDEETAAIVRGVQSGQGTTAVLCRYNHDRGRIQRALEVAGLARPQTERQIPADWKKALAGLRLLVQPTDRMALRRWESAGGTLPFNPPRDVPGFCEALGLSHDMRRLLDKAVKTGGVALPEGATEAALWLWEWSKGESPPEEDRNVVCTVHAAKGREWDNVIIQGVDAATYGKKPEEDRRLLFVAMTRARKNLALTSCRWRLDPYSAKMVEHEPSPFLKEF